MQFKFIDGKKINSHITYINDNLLIESNFKPNDNSAEYDPIHDNSAEYDPTQDNSLDYDAKDNKPIFEESTLEELNFEMLREIEDIGFNEDISYDDRVFKHNVFTKKLEKIPGKFIRNKSFANVQVATDCEDVEFIDHEIEIITNEDSKYGSKQKTSTKQKLKILKLKNLLIQAFKPGQYSNANFVEKNNDYPTRVIKGKKFIVLAFDAIFHGCSEFYGQFELLHEFDNDIKPFFIFGHHNHEYHKGIFDIYKKEFNLDESDVFLNDRENVCIEEVYILFDTNAFISESIDEKFNMARLIPCGPLSGIATYYRVDRKIVETTLEKDSIFPLTSPDHATLRYGLLLMAKRHKKYINLLDKKIDVLYISRENYSNSFHESLKKSLEEESINPINFFHQCQTFFRRTILDEDNFFDLLKIFFFHKEKTIKKVFFEDLNYIDQISLVKNSDVVISLQGSGLCNAIFADKETKIIEICHPFDDPKFRAIYNPISVDTEEKHINYMKIGNWYSLLYSDWKYESVEILEDEKIIEN